MSLENLVKINQLQHHKTNPEEIARLCAAARRNLADATHEGISEESRFDMAYKAIIDNKVWVVLDTLRKKRNLSDYWGDLIEPAAVRKCIEHAQSLFAVTQACLNRHRPDLAPREEI